MPKDDLDIEFDEDVERVIKEPKSIALMKFLDYRDARKAKEQEIADEKKKKEKVDKPFWEF
jgi:hypothetical protein